MADNVDLEEFARQAAESLRENATEITRRVEAARARALAAGDTTDMLTHPVAEMVLQEPTQRVRDVPVSRALSDSKITAPQQRILNGMAWLAAAGIEQPLRVQVAFLAEQSPRSSGYRNNLSALRTAGLLSYNGSGSLALTKAGKVAAEAPRGRLTAADFQATILQQLPNPQARILRVLIDAYPQDRTREHVAQRASQSPTSSGYRNNLSALRTLGLITYHGGGRLAALPVCFAGER